ncbi:hypothetical protein, partial [Desulfotomaculum copahuensis]|uniref:hypothetical protein n=1 Tax=Desulfotomaculum copahuensis TaxID=1838280 RepID=UPI000B2ECA04
QMGPPHGDISRLELLETMSGLARSMPFYVDLWKVQNIYHRLLLDIYPGYRDKANRGEESGRTWVNHFERLGDKLQMERGV